MPPEDSPASALSQDPRQGPLHGLYVITDPLLTPPHTLQLKVEAALLGGARIVQYRDKSSEHGRREREARALQSLCEAHNAVFIVNDDLALAQRIGAGLHIGAQDTRLAQARARLGEHSVIGVTCYDSLTRAQQAQEGGADYVAFGRFFASPTKPQASPAPLALLREARHALDLPICAIGGIGLHTAPQVIGAGAHMIAVVSAVFAAQDPRQGAQALAGLLRP